MYSSNVWELWQLGMREWSRALCSASALGGAKTTCAEMIAYTESQLPISSGHRLSGGQKSDRYRSRVTDPL